MIDDVTKLASETIAELRHRVTNAELEHECKAASARTRSHWVGDRAYLDLRDARAEIVVLKRKLAAHNAEMARGGEISEAAVEAAWVYFADTWPHDEAPTTEEAFRAGCAALPHISAGREMLEQPSWCFDMEKAPRDNTLVVVMADGLAMSARYERDERIIGSNPSWVAEDTGDVVYPTMWTANPAQQPSPPAADAPHLPAQVGTMEPPSTKLGSLNRRFTRKPPAADASTREEWG